MLGRAPEFLLAHRASPAGIVLITLLIAWAVPLAVGAAVALVARLGGRAGRVAEFLAVFAATFLIALLAAKGTGLSGLNALSAAALIAISALALYDRSALVRTFITWLAPGLVVFPLVFVATPGIRAQLFPSDAGASGAAASDTPVVMVVFDQLPLTSLLGADGRIDRARYPSFASLAGRSTWYRNATTVSDYTRWALPAILTGRDPRARTLPVAADHPESLFTLLGASHRVHAFEPITALCPRRICEVDNAPLGPWLRGIARTLGLVYLHAVLPSDFAAGLPPVDHGWHDAAPEASIGERWYDLHRTGRRQRVLDFIDAIDAPGPGLPPFHFLHVLLPHEPFIYLPDGQRFSVETRLPGLIDREFWQDDGWAVTQAYRRHLLQVAHVDTLLGRLIARLEETGLFDRALVVVTSDHGASFRPGRPFRRITRETFMDILPVPLLVKYPGQRDGTVDDRNVEAIDITPTITDAAGVPGPSRADGRSVLGEGAARPVKRVFRTDATESVSWPASIVPDVIDAARRRQDLFAGRDPNPYFVPAASPEPDLIGRDVSTLRVADGFDGTFHLNVHGDYSNVDPGGAFLPAYLAGSVTTPSGAPVALAIAANGRIDATTRTYRFDAFGLHGAWSAVLSPPAFRRGSNTLEIFVVDRDEDGRLLRRVYRSSDADLDLSAPAATYAWGVEQEGFHDREWSRGTPFRWTGARARLIVPLRGGQRPRALRVVLLRSGRNGKPLRVTVDGCRVFDGPLPAGRWSRDFDLAPCGTLGPTLRIELTTEIDRARDRTDRRRLGVAVERIDLIDAHPGGG